MNGYQSLAPWRGCKNVMFGYYNDYADPDLLYKGYNFNYYDIEDVLWENFESDCANGIEGLKAEGGDAAVDKAFDEYVRENADSYLDDAIANGYFRGDSKSWHDKM